MGAGPQHAPAGRDDTWALPITSSRMSYALDRAYRVLGFEDAAGGDVVFRQLVLARMIEPVSKLDSLRVLEEAGAAAVSYRTVKRRLPVYAQEAVAAVAVGLPAPRTRSWDGPAWSLRRQHLCISRLTRVTGSASRGSPRSGGWSRRSPSGC